MTRYIEMWYGIISSKNIVFFDISQNFWYRPISITPVLSRVLERLVVRAYIYPSLQQPPPGICFTDQFAFRPTGSTTAALVTLLHTVVNRSTCCLLVHSYVCLPWTSPRHSTWSGIPRCWRRWLASIFRMKFIIGSFISLYCRFSAENSTPPLFHPNFTGVPFELDCRCCGSEERGP